MLVSSDPISVVSKIYVYTSRTHHGINKKIVSYFFEKRSIVLQRTVSSRLRSPDDDRTFNGVAARVSVAVPRREISHDGPLPHRPPLTRSPMRFRTNVEDVGSFFSESLKMIFENAINDAFDSYRDYTSH